MVASERIVIALTASDGGLASCFTSVSAPPNLLPFIRGLGIESLSDFVHFVTKAGYGAELRTCLAASPELADDRMALARLRAAWVSGERAISNRVTTLRHQHSVTLMILFLTPPSKRFRRHGVIDTTTNSKCMAPADTLVSRFHQEYRRCTPRDLMLSGDVQLTTNRDQDVLVDAVYDYRVGLHILGNASAMVGNFLARDLLDYADQTMR